MFPAVPCHFSLAYIQGSPATQITSIIAFFPDLGVRSDLSRSRVNALEYVMIPNLQETIRYISMKLDEQERSTLSRLMKIKEIVRSA